MVRYLNKSIETLFSNQLLNYGSKQIRTLFLKRIEIMIIILGRRILFEYKKKRIVLNIISIA
jgi:hypothetical protein